MLQNNIQIIIKYNIFNDFIKRIRYHNNFEIKVNK